MRIAADQRWLQTVIRFQAGHRAKRRLGTRDVPATRVAGDALLPAMRLRYVPGPGSGCGLVPLFRYLL